jgi:UDP-N-acetylglucosamine--N-acetylmuramyl-(pentapeptide) pyrophosphoryl-undecaprenol N-acetylglucosamine transferase
MKYVLAAGGSGGHLIPAARVGKVLRARGHSVFYMGSVFGAVDILGGAERFDHGAAGWAGTRGLNRAASFLKMGRALWRCSRRLRQIRPDAVCGFGGFGAFPAVYAAGRLKVPALIHEQNILAGRANRWLARHGGPVAISFEESRPCFPGNEVFLTGCPCNYDGKIADKGASYRRFGFFSGEGRFTVLVLGGSQGSRTINEIVPAALAGLTPLMDLQCVHCSGAADRDAVDKVYELAGIPRAVFSFLTGMEEAYAVADLVIGRAGALTVSEIMAYRRRAVLVPYPHAGEHQLANARALERKNMARVCMEGDLTVQRLQELILESRERRRPDPVTPGLRALPEHNIADLMEKLSK